METSRKEKQRGNDGVDDDEISGGETGDNEKQNLYELLGVTRDATEAGGPGVQHRALRAADGAPDRIPSPAPHHGL